MFWCVVFFALQTSEDVSKTLLAIKNMLYGTGEQDPQTELNAQLAQEMYNNNMLQLLIQNLHKIDFEVTLRAFLTLSISWRLGDSNQP